MLGSIKYFPFNEIKQQNIYYLTNSVYFKTKTFSVFHLKILNYILNEYNSWRWLVFEEFNEQTAVVVYWLYENKICACILSKIWNSFIALLYKADWLGEPVAQSGLARWACCPKWAGSVSLLPKVGWLGEPVAQSGLARWACCPK